VFKLREQGNHPRFRREGNDLHHTMHITLKEALLGFRKSVLHLDGRMVRACAVAVLARACAVAVLARACAVAVLARACAGAVLARACAVAVLARACAVAVLARTCASSVSERVYERV
jgi:hypothetical protein